MANLTEFYEKNNLSASCAVVSLADILSCNILAGVSNRVINCNYGIKNFGLCRNFSSFGVRFIRISPKLSISIMEIGLSPRFPLSFFVGKPFCGPVSVIQ